MIDEPQDPTVETEGYAFLNQQLIETRCFDDENSYEKRRCVLDLSAIVSVREEYDHRLAVRFYSGVMYIDLPFDIMKSLMHEARD